MMKITAITFLFLCSAYAFAQGETKILRDIFPTQTHDWIDCKLSMPGKFKVKKNKYRFLGSRRAKYSYQITPADKKIHENVIGMHLAPYIYADSMAIETLSLFYQGNVIDYQSSFRGVVSDDFLFAYKRFDLGRVTYFFTISVKHNQKKEDFDIHNFLWFIDFVNSIEYLHTICYCLVPRVSLPDSLTCALGASE